VLTIVCAVVFIPFGALLRLRRHDPMGPSFDPTATSYWLDRKAGTASTADRLKEQCTRRPCPVALL